MNSALQVTADPAPVVSRLSDPDASAHQWRQHAGSVEDAADDPVFCLRQRLRQLHAGVFARTVVPGVKPVRLWRDIVRENRRGIRATLLDFATYCGAPIIIIKELPATSRLCENDVASVARTDGGKTTCVWTGARVGWNRWQQNKCAFWHYLCSKRFEKS